jgi:hypothetical protein
MTLGRERLPRLWHLRNEPPAHGEETVDSAERTELVGERAIRGVRRIDGAFCQTKWKKVSDLKKRSQSIPGIWRNEPNLMACAAGAVEKRSQFTGHLFCETKPICHADRYCVEHGS